MLRLAADMEALMVRKVRTEQALMDTRQQVAAVAKVTAPLVDARKIGEAPTFTGEHKDWSEWSFQFTAYMGSANPESIEALRWAAMRRQDHSRSGGESEFRGTQSSAVSCLGTAVQRKCTGDSEEH